MKLKMLVDKQILGDLKVEKSKEYELLDIILDTYKIAVPRKQKGKYYTTLINENDGELVD